MESEWNFLLIFGPVAVVATLGVVLASVLSFSMYGWRGWKPPLVAAIMGAAALGAVYWAIG